MGGIGYIIGGALSGIGEGLEKQSILNEESRQKTEAAELAARRDQALEALRHTNRTAEIQLQGTVDDTKDANHQARGFSYETKTTSQKQGFEQQNIRLKGSIDANLERLKSSNTITEQAADDARQLQHDLQVAGVTADHWEVTTDGRIVAFNKKGEVLKYSANADSFVPKSSGSDDELGGDGTIAGERGTRSGAAPAAKPAAQNKPTGQQSPDQGNAKAAALAALGNAYAKASQNPEQYRKQYPGMFDAQGNLLPRATLIQRVNQRYGG